MSSEIERACWVAWEKGFRAGAGSYAEQPKNPYSYNGAERPPMPEFPELRCRLDENAWDSAQRWNVQLREFKTAWDEWAGGLR